MIAGFFAIIAAIIVYLLRFGITVTVHSIDDYGRSVG